MTKYTDEASAFKNALDSSYQETLVSGTNISTINGQSLLNGGNITIQGGGISHSDVYDDIILFADTMMGVLQPIKTYNALFDGTETLAVSSGTVSASDGVLTATGGFYAHLTDYTIINNNLWEVSFEAKTSSSNCAVLISEVGQTERDKYELNIQSGGRVTTYYKNQAGQIEVGAGFNSGNWTSVNVKKTSPDTLELTIGNTSKTYTNFGIGELFNLEFGLCSWQSSTLEVRNLVITTDTTTINYDTVVYEPVLDSNTDVTVLTSPCSIDTTDSSLTGASGYLTTGFTNTPHWRIELQAKLTGYGSNCSVLLASEDIGSNKDLLQLLGNLKVVSYSGTTKTEAERTLTNGISTTGYSTVVIEKVNSKYIKCTVDDSTVTMGYWNNLSEYESIMVGIMRWVANSDMRIKSIVVKAPSNEVN